MTTLLTAYLVRHGQTEFNATGRIQGWIDVPLDDVGRKQTALLSQRFADKHLDAIYTSPLARAAETAYAIAKATPASVTLDERLREYHMGDWAGLTGDEINATSPNHVNWDGPELQIPNGETAHQMHDRVTLFLRDVLAKHTGADERVVIVAHGGTLGAMVGVMLGMPVLRRQPFSFGNTAVTKAVREGNRWRLRSLNDMCHLQTETQVLQVS